MAQVINDIPSFLAYAQDLGFATKMCKNSYEVQVVIEEQTYSVWPTTGKWRINATGEVHNDLDELLGLMQAVYYRLVGEHPVVHGQSKGKSFEEYEAALKHAGELTKPYVRPVGWQRISMGLHWLQADFTDVGISEQEFIYDKIMATIGQLLREPKAKDNIQINISKREQYPDIAHNLENKIVISIEFMEDGKNE